MRFSDIIKIVKLVWAIIPLVVFSIIGISESSAEEPIILSKLTDEQLFAKANYLLSDESRISILDDIEAIIEQVEEIKKIISEFEQRNYLVQASVRFDHKLMKPVLDYVPEVGEPVEQPLKEGEWQNLHQQVRSGMVNGTLQLQKVLIPINFKNLPEDRKKQVFSPMIDYPTPTDPIDTYLQELIDSGKKRLKISIIMVEQPKLLTDEEEGGFFTPSEIAEKRQRLKNNQLASQVELVDFLNKNNSTILTQNFAYVNGLKAEVPADIIGELRNREDVGYIGSLEGHFIASPYISTDDDLMEKPIAHFLPPKQQLKKGIAPEEVVCKESLELIFKSKDGSPACVKPQTAEKLIERGWANEN